MRWGEFLPSWVRSSFNVWEAKNLIGGQKYVVIMSILKHVTWRALQSRNIRSFRINIKFVLVFESQTLGYKPNPVSCEKIFKLLCQILKNRSAYRWRNTVSPLSFNYIELWKSELLCQNKLEIKKIILHELNVNETIKLNKLNKHFLFCLKSQHTKRQTNSVIN